MSYFAVPSIHPPFHTAVWYTASSGAKAPYPIDVTSYRTTGDMQTTCGLSSIAQIHTPSALRWGPFSAFRQRTWCFGPGCLDPDVCSLYVRTLVLVKLAEPHRLKKKESKGLHHWYTKDRLLGVKRAVQPDEGLPSSSLPLVRVRNAHRASCSKWPSTIEVSLWMVSSLLWLEYGSAKRKNKRSRFWHIRDKARLASGLEFNVVRYCS